MAANLTWGSGHHWEWKAGSQASRCPDTSHAPRAGLGTSIHALTGPSKLHAHPAPHQTPNQVGIPSSFGGVSQLHPNKQGQGSPAWGPTLLLSPPRNGKKNLRAGTSLVARWLRIRLPVQETRVRALVWEDPTCRGATKPVHHNY